MCVCVFCIACVCVCHMYRESGDQWGVDRLSVDKQAGGFPLSLFSSPHFPELLTGSVFCSAQGHCNTVKVWKARDTKSSMVRQHFSTPLLILNCTRASVKAVNYQIVSPLHDTAGGIMGKNYSLLIKCQICCCTTALQMFWPCYFMLFCSHPVFTQTAFNSRRISAFNKNKSVPYCHKL